MSWFPIILGFVLAAFILSAMPKVKDRTLRAGVVLGAVLAVALGVLFSSVRYVPSDQVGLVDNKVFGSAMKPGQVIALEGEVGTQAKVLTPGWHLWYWPGIYDVKTVPLVSVGDDEVGLIKAVDGRPLKAGQVFAEELSTERFKELVDNPVKFLTEAGGQKGPQTNVLLPGEHRINTELFEVTLVDQTEVPAGMVAVLKSNVGGDPTIEMQAGVDGTETVYLAQMNEKGVRAEPLPPGKYPLNPKAFEVYTVSTERRVANYTAESRAGTEALGAISVKSNDGFNFPVDVRVVYYIQNKNAPRVVALLGGDNDKLQQVLTSRVRSIFRDNAESVSALDYINQRSTQARSSAQKLREAMASYGISIESVDIGEVVTSGLLDELLQTQRDRKIASEQQETFKVQQDAAEQEKELTRTQQEALEEKRLATARYEVQIAEQDKERRIIEATAEAEAIRIEAEAQASAYRAISAQIGQSNAALIEMLKRIGEDGISITPRVMVTGGAGPGAGRDGEMVALIGTMLDSMVRETPDEREGRASSPRVSEGDDGDDR